MKSAIVLPVIFVLFILSSCSAAGGSGGGGTGGNPQGNNNPSPSGYFSGDGVDIQPDFYNNGNVDFGWSLMKQYPNIKTVRIMINTADCSYITIAQAAGWIAQATSNGYNVIAAYTSSATEASSDTALLNSVATWWKTNYSTLSPQGNVVINLVNEWGDTTLTGASYAAAYNSAISIVRSAYNGAIIIDVPNYGEDIYTAAQASPLISDTNIIFSVHVYPDSSDLSAPSVHGLTNSDFDELSNTGRPCILGEFGVYSDPQYGTNCSWSGLAAYARSIGWTIIAWDWNGDGSGVNMDMVNPSWCNNAAATSFSTDSYFSTVYPMFRTAGAGSYTITAAAGTGGTISPSGAVSVSQGASQSFAISPSSPGMSYVYTVSADGTDLGGLTSYTFNNVQANHTITTLNQPGYLWAVSYTNSGSSTGQQLRLTLFATGSFVDSAGGAGIWTNTNTTIVAWKYTGGTSFASGTKFNGIMTGGQMTNMNGAFTNGGTAGKWGAVQLND